MSTFHEWKVGYGYSVVVTHINDPKSFFVRMADLSNFMDIIERPGSDSASASTMRLGQKVVYKSNILKKFVRGQIHYITNNEEVTCDIYAIDYGCLDKSVSTRHIHPPDSSAEPQNQCPGLATHCRLYLCEPRGGDSFSEEVIEIMRDMVDEQDSTINVVSKLSDQLVVELINYKIPRDMATYLGMIDLTTMTKGLPKTAKDCQVDRMSHSLTALNLTQTLKYKHKQLDVGEMFRVRVQSGKSASGFYVADINDFKQLRSEAYSLKQYVKSRHMKDEEFVPGRVCAVKLNDIDPYERAIIKKVNPNSTAILELVDWGTEIESKFSCIRSIAKEFYLTQPIIAIYCSTSEDQIWTPSFFPKGYQLGIKIMELGNCDKPHKVNIYPMCMLHSK